MKTKIIENNYKLESYNNIAQKGMSGLNSISPSGRLNESFSLDSDMGAELFEFVPSFQNKILSLKEDNKSESSGLELVQPVLIQSGEKIFWVRLQDIHYFESCGNHSVVAWQAEKAIVNRALVGIESRLPLTHFIRANRKHIVNVTHVASVEMWVNGGFRLTLTSGVNIEVSRRQSNCFREKFSL